MGGLAGNLTGKHCMSAACLRVAWKEETPEMAVPVVSSWLSNKVTVSRGKCILFEVRSALCPEPGDFSFFCSDNKMVLSFTELRNCKFLEKAV